MIRKSKKRTGILFIRNINRDIKDRFKSTCAARGIFMTERIEQLMTEAIRRDSKHTTHRRKEGEEENDLIVAIRSLLDEVETLPEVTPDFIQAIQLARQCLLRRGLQP